MDLLDRINALTDDQLRMIADRDDASGVLASYRLAELRGLPAPDRSVVVLAEDYAIVAVDGKIERIEIEGGVSKIIREEGGEFCVYSEDGSQSFGCYPSMRDAEERLRQIHYFEQAADTEKAIREGSFVSWNSSGGRARGRVEYVMTEGTLGVPDSDFSINAEPDDPAVLIRIWRQGPDGWAETETLVGHKMSTLTQIDPLSKQTKREDGQDFPAEAFAYVPDPEKPSTWKLRLWDSLDERETRTQVGAAIAALGPGGFRGNRVEIPADDLPGVKRRVLTAWRKVWGDEAPDEIPAVLKAESYAPPQGVQEAAQRALDWIAEGHAGSGFTDVGRARAAQLARGDNVSEDTIRRMASYFARHEIDSQATGWNLGEEGFPTPGRVAWDAWGGDPGRTWAESIVGGLEKNGSYGYPLSWRQEVLYDMIEDVAETFGLFNDGNTGSGAHYMDDNPFAAQGIKCANCVFFRGGGGCEILDRPVSPKGICKFWIIPDDLLIPRGDMDKARFLRKADEARFTLGPLYVPDFMDAHGEWTDADELQPAVWGWVRSGDRRIFLQHDTEVEAGEWVEVMTMPQAWTVDMLDQNGKPIGQVTYPPNTVFLGVIWNEEAWELVKAGQLRGYSIGGFSDRVLADMPLEAEREGIELGTPEEPQDLAKAIAAAVAAAMRDTQPIVNVVLPEPRVKARKIERDEHGNIARIVEEED